MSITDDLGYKIGGKVPVWIASVGLAGGYILYDRKKKSAAAATSAASTAATAAANPVGAATGGTLDPYSGVDPTTGLPYQQEYAQEQSWQNSPMGQFLSSDPTNTAFPVGIVPDASSGYASGELASPVTNAQWAEVAQNYLISKGSSPTEVLTAIQNFINGVSLSAQDQALVNLAMSDLGSPPQQLTPNLTGSNPGPSVPSNPVGPSTVPTPPGPSEGSGIPAGYALIPNPSVGSQLSAAKVPWVTVGKSQYYDTQYLTHIPNPSTGSSLFKRGYHIVTMNNAQYYNPYELS